MDHVRSFRQKLETRLSRSKQGRLALDFIAQVSRDQLTTWGAAFAYHTIFAIPPLIVLTVALAGIFDRVSSVDLTAKLQSLINNRAPSNTQALLNSIVDTAIGEVGSGSLSIGVIVTVLLALWSGSNALGSLMNAFNIAYGVQETRSWLRQNATSVGLTLVMALSINVAFLLLVFGQRIGDWLANWIGAGSQFNTAWNLVRWPVALLLVAILLALLYHYGPNVQQGFRWVSPGSLLATLLWLLAVAFFGLYLRFSNPGSAYGAMGAIIVLLFFLYVSGMIFLFGAELNAVIERSSTRLHDQRAHTLASRQSAAPISPAGSEETR